MMGGCWVCEVAEPRAGTFMCDDCYEMALEIEDSEIETLC